jgi:eukaryotic-like serine/threonine-protein kinase
MATNERLDQPTRTISNRYELLEQIGIGGMGIVYSALDHLTGQMVALKRVLVTGTPVERASKPSQRDTGEFRMALAQEFKILASLRHPYIVSVLDYGFDGARRPYFTMELLPDARPLVEAARTMFYEQQIHLLLQLLQALAYLHRRGLLHRDLKPANVMVVGETVKVVDFGLAVAEGYVGETVGTLGYTAPELLRGEAGCVESDLYAVGVMAYEMLTGEYPFDPIEGGHLIQQVLTQEPPFERHGLDKGIERVLRTLLAKLPEARYESAADAIRALASASEQPIPNESPAIRESYLQAARFVGREAELTQLTGALAESYQGQGSAWLIAGESGVGKSRLLDEVRIRALVDGAMVLRGQAIQEGASLYSLWLPVWRWLCLLTEMSDLEAGVLKPFVPDIEALLNRTVPDAPELESYAVEERLLSVIEALFRRQKQPMVVILEDLHWARESLSVFRRLSRTAERQALLLIGTYRDDETPDLPARLPEANGLTLRRFDRGSIEALAESMLGEAGKSAELVDWLERETEGNAFFLVEVARALAERSGSLRDIGRQLSAQIAAGGVEQVVRRRLARVPEDLRPLLEVAAVAGRRIDLNVLRVLTPAANFDSFLTACANAAVLEMTDGAWRFTHDKLRTGALAMLDADTRTSMHRLVAETLEHLYPDAPEHAATLAHHWQAAGEIEREIYYVKMAGEQALHMRAFREAKGYFERLLALLPEEESGAARAEWGFLQIQLGKVYRGLGAFAECETAYRSALEVFQALRDRRGIANALNNLGSLMRGQGKYAEAKAALTESLALCREIGDARGVAITLNYLGSLARSEGHYVKAEQMLSESLMLHEQLGDQQGMALVLNNLGFLARVEQRYDEANEILQRSLEFAIAIWDRRNIALNLVNLGFVARMQMRYADAADTLIRSLEMYTDLSDRWGMALATCHYGYVLLETGDAEQARARFEESLKLFGQMGAEPETLLALAGIGTVMLCNGNAEAALELYGLIEVHPATPADTMNYIRPLLDEAGAALALDGGAIARARGRALTVVGVVQGLTG